MSVSLVSSSFLFQNLVDSTKQKGNLLINGCFFSGKSRRDVPDPCPDPDTVEGKWYREIPRWENTPHGGGA